MTSTKIAMASLSQSPMTLTGTATASPSQSPTPSTIDHRLEPLQQAQVNRPQIWRLELRSKPKPIAHDID
jgi:hypothetical protein